MTRDIIQELKIANINDVVSPYESDSQFGFMMEQGILDIVVCEDADLLANGCKWVLVKLQADGFCESIRFADVLALPKFNNPIKFTPAIFLTFCVYSGCDYFKLKRTRLNKAYKTIVSTNGVISEMIKKAN
eukprot:Pompholyxophrys_punicea_v1_NODE_926_length_1132_cov_2.105850.p1 type:complete len:131 gc:universal NODE_926_length_1132_cov_2.105850:574-966(+)